MGAGGGTSEEKNQVGVFGLEPIRNCEWALQNSANEGLCPTQLWGWDGGGAGLVFVD